MKKQPVTIIDYSDHTDMIPSALGRTFADRKRAVNHAMQEGFTHIARVRGNSGYFYAPLTVDPRKATYSGRF